jgi:pyridoxal phosphate enzyme (YggS family)
MTKELTQRYTESHGEHREKNYFHSMSEITANIIAFKKSLPGTVKLVAVSKTRPVADIMEAYKSGQRCFGENRVQELLNKKDLLPSDIEWHLIGHLQRNKVKFIVSFISMIQSVDSLRLLEVINEEAKKAGRVVDILLQVYIAREETKFGFIKEEIEQMVEAREFAGLTNVRICGLMGMATFTSDREQVRMEFRSLARLFNELKKKYFTLDDHFREISMGMSGDFKTAVKEGSTIVRIGSLIFGERMKNDN